MRPVARGKGCDVATVSRVRIRSPRGETRVGQRPAKRAALTMLDLSLAQEVDVELVGEAQRVETDVARKRAIELWGLLQERHGRAHGHGHLGRRGGGARRDTRAREGRRAGDGDAGDEGNHLAGKKEGNRESEGIRGPAGWDADCRGGARNLSSRLYTTGRVQALRRRDAGAAAPPQDGGSDKICGTRSPTSN